jgi:methylmalonyl-CoA mutase C-terminal domain/subunit
MTKQALKVIMAKLGLDGHDRGILLVSQWLRDAGLEVIYLGGYQTPENVANAAMQEDAKVIGLSFAGGDHLFHTKKMVEKMKEKGLEETVLVVGGVFPDQDIPKLKELGAQAVFVAGSPMQNIVDYLKELSESIV